jgi:hypothetical protein
VVCAPTAASLELQAVPLSTALNGRARLSLTA